MSITETFRTESHSLGDKNYAQKKAKISDTLFVTENGERSEISTMLIAGLGLASTVVLLTSYYVNNMNKEGNLNKDNISIVETISDKKIVLEKLTNQEKINFILNAGNLPLNNDDRDLTPSKIRNPQLLRKVPSENKVNYNTPIKV